MVRPTQPLTPLTSEFACIWPTGEFGPSRVATTRRWSCGRSRRAREPHRRYGKGGRARQSSNRPPPEYVHDIEDRIQSPVSSESDSSQNSSDAGTEQGGVNIAELPATDRQPHDRASLTAMAVAETSRGAADPWRSNRFTRPKQHLSKREREEERLFQLAARMTPAQSRAVAETKYPAMLNDSRSKLKPTQSQTRGEQPRRIANGTHWAMLNDAQSKHWDRTCYACMKAWHRESMLWSWVEDLTERLDELEADLEGLLGISDGLIEYLKENGLPQRVD